MKNNYADKITLNSLASFIGYSPTHFQKIFTQTMHISPQKYLETIRINQAKYLLSQHSQSISDIAYNCGFSSQPHFTLVFRQHTGMTPKEFRKSELEKYIL